MSLLMEALKKAEEAKRRSAATATAPADLSLEPPAPAMPPPVSPLPKLDDHLATLDADLEAVAASPRHRTTQTPAPATTSPPNSDPADERQSARNLFTAKMAAAENRSPNRTALWVGLGTLVLGLGGIGGYLWMQLQGLGQSGMMPPATLPTLPIPPTPPITVPIAAPSPSQSAPAMAAQGTSPPSDREMPAPPPQERSQAQDRPKTQLPEEPVSPIRLTRGKPAGNPTLERAYAALQREDFEAASRDYDKVLQSDARNTDALLGLAAIAGREGQNSRAEALYLKALEADPKHPVALAGLVSLLGGTDPAAAESRLKNLLASQPEAGHAHFALGNIYARQGRWNEAQQAYFKSLAGDGDNPDYLFNLAVSLDHLRQAKAALQYYQAALAAAAARPAAFDKDGCRRRIQELSNP